MRFDKLTNPADAAFSTDGWRRFQYNQDGEWLPPADYMLSKEILRGNEIVSLLADSKNGMPLDPRNIERIAEKPDPGVNLQYNDFASKYLSFNNNRQNSFNLQMSTKQSQQTSVLLQRLPAGQQQALNKNQNLLNNSDFLTLADKLTSDELSQFIQVADVLYSSPSTRHRLTSIPDGNSSVKKFISTLNRLDDDARTQVLQQASLFSSRVAPPSSTATYDTNGVVGTNDSEANNNLHNFISVVNSTEDLNNVLDTLARFDEKQQSNVLNILTVSPVVGERLLTQLGEFEENTQDVMLNYLGDIAKRIAPTGQQTNSQTTDPVKQYGAFEDVSKSDNNRKGLIEDSTHLLERYAFSDDQLIDMVEQLKPMKESDQQAYLKITSVGLDHIVGVRENDKVDQVQLAEHQQALDTIDLLRTDSSVRELVAKSGLGNKVLNEQDQTLYTMKNQATAIKDQQAMINLLTTDAWIRLQNNTGSDLATQTHNLAEVFLDQQADLRDLMATKINGYSQNTESLTSLSTEELNQTYINTYARTSTLANTESVSLILAVETSNISEAINNAYWQTLSLAGERVDEMASAILAQPGLIRSQSMQFFANSLDSVVHGESSREQAKNELHDFIDYMQQEPDKNKKQLYLNELTGQDVPLYWAKVVYEIDDSIDENTSKTRALFDLQAQAWQTYNKTGNV